MRAIIAQTGPNLNLRPGKQLEIAGCILVRLENGKVVEEFEYSDYLGFMHQLGVVPAFG